MVEGDDSELGLPRRRLWPVLVVLVLLLGAAAALAVVIWRRPEPLRVLVAVDVQGYWWEGSRPAAVIADGLAERLTELGFEPVVAGDPEVTEVLQQAESPEQAAEELGAAFVVGGRLAPEIIEHPIAGGYFETRVKGPVRLQHLDDAVAKDVGTVAGWSGAKDKKRALGLLGESLSDQVFDVVLPALMAHPAIVDFVENGDVADVARLEKAKGYIGLRKSELERARKAYADFARERAAREEGPRKVTYHATLDRQQSLCGVSKRGVLARSADIRPFFSPIRNELGYIEGLERLYWIRPGQPEKEVFAGYNIFSYPTVAPEGSPVVLVEDLFGWAKTITAIGENGERRRLMIDPEHRFSDPKLSPGGGYVAVWDRACRRCPKGLLVLKMADGKPVYRTDPEKQGTLGGFAWVAADRLLYLHRPVAESTEGGAPAAGDAAEDDDAPQQLRAVLLGKPAAQAEVLATAQDDESWGAPSASADGAWLAMERYANDAKHLVLYGVKGGELSRLEAGRRVRNPVLSADGARVAFDGAGGIALYDVASGQVSTLTKNPFRERYPVFSADDQRVFFESRDRDPLFRRRSVSVIASVSVK